MADGKPVTFSHETKAVIEARHLAWRLTPEVKRDIDSSIRTELATRGLSEDGRKKLDIKFPADRETPVVRINGNFVDGKNVFGGDDEEVFGEFIHDLRKVFYPPNPLSRNKNFMEHDDMLGYRLSAPTIGELIKGINSVISHKELKISEPEPIESPANRLQR